MRKAVKTEQCRLCLSLSCPWTCESAVPRSRETWRSISPACHECRITVALWCHWTTRGDQKQEVMSWGMLLEHYTSWSLGVGVQLVSMAQFFPAGRCLNYTRLHASNNQLVIGLMALIDLIGPDPKETSKTWKKTGKNEECKCFNMTVFSIRFKNILHTCAVPMFAESFYNKISIYIHLTFYKCACVYLSLMNWSGHWLFTKYLL